MQKVGKVPIICDGTGIRLRSIGNGTESTHEIVANRFYRRTWHSVHGNCRDIQDAACILRSGGAGTDRSCTDQSLTQNAGDCFVDSGGDLVQVICSRDQSRRKQQRVVVARQ